MSSRVTAGIGGSLEIFARPHRSAGLEADDRVLELLESSVGTPDDDGGATFGPPR